jgi:hypothetical protein
MRIDNMIQSLRLLAKADAMIAEAAFKARLSEIVLRAAAFCICVFGLVMLGIAIFFALRDLWGMIWAAVAVGLGSLAFSAFLVAFSVYRRPRNDLQIAHDMHKMAFDSLIEEARLAGSDFANVRALLRSATTGGTLVGIVAPLLGLLLRFLKRRGGDPQHQ